MFRNSKVEDKVYTTSAGVTLVFRIKKVGTKYLYVNIGRGRDIKYCKSTGEHKDTHCYTNRLYLTRQEILDKREVSDLGRKLWLVSHNNNFDYLSLDQLRRIHAIIEE